MLSGGPAGGPTGFTFGDGGIAMPRRGVRVPDEDRAPGIAGRRRGAGEEESIVGAGWDTADATGVGTGPVEDGAGIEFDAGGGAREEVEVEEESTGWGCTGRTLGE